MQNLISKRPSLLNETEISSNGVNRSVNNMCQFFISIGSQNAFLNLLEMVVYVMELTRKPLSNIFKLMRDFSWGNVNSLLLTGWSQNSTNVQNKPMYDVVFRETLSDSFFSGILFPEALELLSASASSVQTEVFLT